MQRPCRVAAYSTAPSDFLRLRCYSTQDHHLRDGTVHSGLDFPMSIISQENAPQACPQATLVGLFSQLQASSKGLSSLFQVNINLAVSSGIWSHQGVTNIAGYFWWLSILIEINIRSKLIEEIYNICIYIRNIN